MDRFAKIHPAFHFVFFISVFVLSVTVVNPVFCAVSLVGAALYIGISRGREVLSCLKFVLAIIVVVGIFNMLFSGYGVTELFKIAHKRFTLEALAYGINQGVMLGATVLWFDAFSHTVDSERVVYLLSFAPKTALIFSMVLGFIPRFKTKARDIREARLGLNGGTVERNIVQKLKSGIHDFGALVTYSMESSIITSNSMLARGYNPSAVRASRYKLKSRDIVLIAVCFLISAYVLYSKASRKTLFIFEPEIGFLSLDYFAIAFFVLLCALPSVIDLTEVVKWKISALKM